MNRNIFHSLFLDLIDKYHKPISVYDIDNVILIDNKPVCIVERKQRKLFFNEFLIKQQQFDLYRFIASKLKIDFWVLIECIEDGGIYFYNGLDNYKITHNYKFGLAYALPVYKSFYYTKKDEIVRFFEKQYLR